MSKPRYDWWGYMRRIIRRYPKCADFERRAVEQAIASTELMPDGQARLKVVEIGLRRNGKNLRTASIMESVSYATAKRWQQSFIREVARNFRCDRLLDDDFD